MRKFLFLLLSTAALVAVAADDPVKINNDYVRVLLARDVPHRKGALHKHDVDRVMVYLDAGDIDITWANGRVEHQHWRPGQVAWSPAGGMHTSENVSSKEIRIAEVELKKPPSGKSFRISPRDPVKINPSHNSLVFENETVRVFRAKFPANYDEPKHEHLSLGRITIPITDLEMTVTAEGAAPVSAKRAAGESTWSEGPLVHSAHSVGAAELVLVELK